MYGNDQSNERPASSPEEPSSDVRRRGVLAGLVGTTLSAGCLERFGITPAALPNCDGEQRTDLSSPVRGNSSAPVTVEAYEDFSCEACAYYNQNVFPDIKREFVDTGDIEYVHRDYLLPIDSWSWKAANAARSIQAQEGDDAFFEFKRELFTHVGEYSTELITELAEAVGASGDPVADAIDDRPYCQLLRDETAVGSEKNVSGTPTIIVDGELFEAPSVDELRDAISTVLE